MSDYHVYPRLRKYIYERDSYSCRYCGNAHSLSCDHVIPRKYGGKTIPENLVAACFSCNEIKGGRTPEEALMDLILLPE